jgi:hypothetical protein
MVRSGLYAGFPEASRQRSRQPCGIVTPSDCSLALTPAVRPALSFPFLGVLFLRVREETENASKEGKEKHMNTEQNPSKEIEPGNRIIKTSGEEVAIPAPQNRTDYTWEELVSFIGGGFIELVRIDRNNFMVVDEDYLAKGLPLNLKATWIYREMALRNGHLTDHVVLGDVAVIAQDQIQ